MRELVERANGRRRHDWSLASKQMAVLSNLLRADDSGKPAQPWDFMPADLRPRRRPKSAERGEFVTGENIGFIGKLLTTGNDE